MIEDNVNINTNLYSRQIGVYGLETMLKLSTLKIFIYGMRGIGVEITKNILLAGPNKVTKILIIIIIIKNMKLFKF